jgi:hypothetical protein
MSSVYYIRIKMTACFIKHHTMKKYGGVDLVPCILTIDTGWKWVLTFVPWLIYVWGKSPDYQLDRQLGTLWGRENLCLC